MRATKNEVNEIGEIYAKLKVTTSLLEAITDDDTAVMKQRIKELRELVSDLGAIYYNIKEEEDEAV